jgi:probable F420-dependent oxidoreductase
MDLGTFGVWTNYRTLGEENAGEAARLVQELGFGTFWLGGSPRVPETRPLLAGADHVTVATAILNVWQNDPGTVAADVAELEAGFPDRMLLGIGIGHREATAEYARPLATVRAFLDGLDAAPTPVPREQRCIAALGPRMLDLCAQRSLGTLTYFVPVAHTRFARERLGLQTLIAVELACVLDSDPARARELGRRYAKLYLGLSNYTSNLMRFGFNEDDLAGGGSDRLIDAIVPHGTAGQIAQVAQEHLAAGANHVCVQPVGVRGVPRAEWSALAGAL